MQDYIRCPLCEEETYKAKFIQSLWEGGVEFKFRVVRCAKCGLYYVNSQNSSNIGKCYIHVDPLKAMRVEAVYRSNIYREGIQQIELLNSKDEPWKILDVGCATGVFLALARCHGYQVFGVESSKRQADWGRKYLKLDIHCSKSLRGLYEQDSFDVVTMWDVLEHIDTPKMLLSEIKRVLRNEGFLIIRIPNGPHQLLKAKVLSRIYPRQNLIGAGEHVVFYDSKTIKEILRKCGFEPMSIRNAVVEHTNDLTRKLQRLKLFVMPVLQLVGNLLRIPVSASLFVVAKNVK